MAYEIFFQDKTSTIVDTADGEKIKEVLLKSKTPQPLEINGEFYKSNFITTIKHASMPTVALPEWDTPVLPEGKKCSGEFSIQREINQIARHDHPSEWAKLIRDTKWREETRQKLRAGGAAWCDAMAGKCACDESFTPAPSRHNV